MKRMDLLTHPKWQQFLIQRSQVITWILNHHPDLFQSPAKAGGFGEAVLRARTHTHTQTPCYLQRFLLRLRPELSAWKQLDFFPGFGLQFAAFHVLSALGRGGQCRDVQSLRVTQSSAAPGVQATPLASSAAAHSPQTCHTPSPKHPLQRGSEVSKLSPLARRCGKAPPVLTPQ